MISDWQTIPLRRVLQLDLTKVRLDAGTDYPMVGVYSFGRGLFLREPVSGNKTSYKFFYKLKAHHIVMSQLFGWEGALALSSEEFEGLCVSPQFPTFVCNETQLDRNYFGWMIRQKSFWKDLGTRTKGMGDRRRTLNPEALLSMEISLPPLKEQHRIATKIDNFSNKVNEVHRFRSEIDNELDRVLLSAYRKIAGPANRRLLGEVAPLTRRPVSVDVNIKYPQIAVRSFGRGTFRKPDLNGEEITWQKPYLVKSGDILISNIKAWEGAIAVVEESDDGRYGSHRYLTCVPIPEIATSRFVCFHLLTREGLLAVGEASPGSADRNRTLGVKALMRIPIPIPPIEKQLWFDELYAKVNALRELQSASGEELSALMPSILDKAFKGEL